MEKEYPYEITGKTRFGGLLGFPVGHSISPQMHNYSFRRLGLDCIYLCFEVKEKQVKQAAEFLRQPGCYGFNLTMPDKQEILSYLDEISPEAKMIGAVNTVVNKEGRLLGYNTDGFGFMESLRQQGFDPSGKEMTLLGAGGAAGAIAVQAAFDGIARLHIANRRSPSFLRAEELADRISKNTGCRADVADLEDSRAVAERIGRSDVLVNATSVGMAKEDGAGQETPVRDISVFRPGLVVGDVIYHPSRTRFLREASRMGCRTFNGMYMLLYQGAGAFRLWTGKDMPVGEVKERYFSVR